MLATRVNANFRVINFIKILLEEARKQKLEEFATFRAICYIKGLGMTKDVDKAILLLKLNANIKLPIANKILAEMYLKGEFVDKDEVLAAKYYYTAAFKDTSGEGFYKYYLCVRDGIGVEKNDKLSVVYLRGAARLGYVKALGTYGKMLYDAPEGECDKQEALKWLLCGVNAQEEEALNVVGNWLIKGEFLPQDLVGGIALLFDAVSKKHEQSAKDLLSYHEKGTICLQPKKLLIIKRMLKDKIDN